MKRFLLLGNFGDENFGDEAVLQFYKQSFKDVEWLVVATNPVKGQYHRLPAGLRSVWTPWYKTLWAYVRCDGVVYAGGTLFTNIESVWACVIWWIHSLPAVFLRKPIYCAFQGVGPLNSRLARTLTQFVLRRVRYISVRDKNSLAVVKTLQTTVEPVLVFDPVLALIPETNPQYTHNCLVIIPRNNSTDAFLEVVKAQARQDWEEVLILSFQPTNEEEGILCNQISTLFPKAGIHAITSVQEAMQYISSASVVVSQRFHGTLFAKAMGKEVQTVPQSTNDKHSSIIAEMSDLADCRSRTEQGVKGLQAILQ